VNDTPDSALVLARRPTYIRHLVLAALCAITTINYLQRNSLAAVQTRVSTDLQVNDIDIGDAISVFFLTYALCQIPSGWRAQSWGAGQALTLYKKLSGRTTRPAPLELPNVTLPALAAA